MKKGYNTYKEGILHFLVYATEEGSFVGACRELCIIKETQDREEVYLRLLAASKSYLTNVIDLNLGDELLNQSLPEEIEEEFNQYVLREEMKKTKNVLEVPKSKYMMTISELMRMQCTR